MLANSAVPTVYHVELGTCLVSDSPRCSLCVENLREIPPRVKFPIRVRWVPVQVQYGSEIVVEDYVDVETASDTFPTVSTLAGRLIRNLIGNKRAENTVSLSGTIPRRASPSPGHELGLPVSEC